MVPAGHSKHSSLLGSDGSRCVPFGHGSSLYWSGPFLANPAWLKALSNTSFGDPPIPEMSMKSVLSCPKPLKSWLDQDIVKPPTEMTFFFIIRELHFTWRASKLSKSQGRKELEPWISMLAYAAWNHCMHAKQFELVQKAKLFFMVWYVKHFFVQAKM